MANANDTANESIISGDTIGNTAYSERFVIGTLIKLLKLNKLEDQELNEFIDNDLCVLWDMAVDSDVCHFLIHQNALEIFCDTLNNHDNFRLTEVVIGTIANMCSHETIVQDINCKEFVRKCITPYISSEDSLIIIQVLRYINCNIYHNSQCLEMWFKLFSELDFLTNVIFILNNSLNHNVLTNAFTLINSLCTLIDDSNEKIFKDMFLNERFSKALIAGFFELQKQSPQGENNLQVTNAEILLIISTIINLETESSIFNTVKNELIHLSNNILLDSINNKNSNIIDIVQYVTSYLIVINNCEIEDIKILCGTMFRLWDIATLSYNQNDFDDSITNFDQLQNILPQYFVRCIALLSNNDLSEITKRINKNSIQALKIKINDLIKTQEIDGYFSNIPNILENILI